MGHFVVEISPSPRQVAVTQEPREVEINLAGLQGPPGTSGGETFIAPCGEIVAVNRVVKVVNGLVYLAQPTLANAKLAIGVSMNNVGQIGDLITVRTDGKWLDSGWAWSPGSIYWGAGGILTQVVPTSGPVLEVGRAISATEVIFDLQLIAMLA
jgi:hypothetical protein